jgi:3alpha(or 20beta)-hydroxysteroid dehydrogenase
VGRLDGKVALITGGARGQGESEARIFAREGAKVVIADVLDDLGRALAADIGEDAVFVHLDVSSEDGWADAISTAESTFGPVSVLVNNAAILLPAAIEETSLADYMAVISVNQVGCFLGMRAVIPAMKAAGVGSIVNISSVDGLQSKNGLVSYTASKFAIRGMTKTAAIELGPYGIRANSIHPGGVNTVMGNPLGTPELEFEPYKLQAIPRIGYPDEIANVALFLASDEASYVTGAEISADGGWRAGVREPGLPGSGLEPRHGGYV